MSYLGSWKIDDLLTFYANTHRFDTGAATDADSVATYRVYEDETTSPLLTGSMALLDSTNTAGFYSEQITLSAANGFEKGKCYAIYIAATVNSVAGATHHTFQIEAEVDANTVSASNVSSNVVQWLGSAAATPTVAGVPEVDVTHWIGTAAATPTVAGVPEVDITHIAGSAVSTSSAQLGVNVVNAAGTAWASGAITSDVIAANAIGESQLGTSAIAEIAGGVWDEDATGHQAQGTFGQAIGDPVADTNTIYKAVVTDATGATVGVDAAAILADTGTDGVVLATGSITAAVIATDAIDADAIADNAIDAGAIAANAITAAKIADGAIDAATFAAGAINAAAIADGAIDAATFAAGAIDAAAIATGAIDADAVASDAVTEIRSIVSGTADSGTTLTMVDSARTEADTDYWKDMAILFTSGTIAGQARLITAFNPATDTITFSPATTQAVSTNTYEIIQNVAAAGASAPTAAEVADAVWDEDATAHQTQGTFGQAIGDPVADANTIYKAVVSDATGATVGVDAAAILADTGTDGVVLASGSITAAVIATAAIDADAIAADAITAAKVATDVSLEIADAVWDEDATGHQTQGSFGQAIGDPVADTNTIYKAVVTDATNATVGADTANILLDVDQVPTANENAAAVWDETRSTHTGVGTFGQGVASVQGSVTGNVDGTVNEVTLPVTLANGAHGGVAAVLTLERVVVASTTTNEPGIKTTGNGTGAGILATGGSGGGTGIIGTGAGASGGGIAGVGSSSDGYGIGGFGGGNGHGFRMARGITGGGDDLSFANNDVTIPNVTTTATVTALGTQAKADVNAEVLDVLNVDTFAQPGQEAPAATTSLSLMLRYLYKFLRNRVTSTATTISVYADDATTVDQKSTHSDSGTTYDRSEFGSGP